MLIVVSAYLICFAERIVTPSFISRINVNCNSSAAVCCVTNALESFRDPNERRPLELLNAPLSTNTSGEGGKCGKYLVYAPDQMSKSPLHDHSSVMPAAMRVRDRGIEFLKCSNARFLPGARKLPARQACAYTVTIVREDRIFSDGFGQSRAQQSRSAVNNANMTRLLTDTANRWPRNVSRERRKLSVFHVVPATHKGEGNEGATLEDQDGQLECSGSLGCLPMN